MKKYRTLSFVIFYIIFVGIGLVFGITPRSIIEAYAEGPLNNGNVLSYYNKEGEIIVLKNGTYRNYDVREDQKKALESAHMLERVFEPTLAEVIAFSAKKPCSDRCWRYFEGGLERLKNYTEGKSICWHYFNNYRNYMNITIVKKDGNEKIIKIIKQEDIKKFFELFPGNDAFSKILFDKPHEVLKELVSKGENIEKKVENNNVNIFQDPNLNYYEILRNDYREVKKYLKLKRLWVDYKKADKIKNFLECFLSATQPKFNCANGGESVKRKAVSIELENFQHTEVQLEALYRAYRNCREPNIKIFLENLLPVILTEPGRDDIDPNIYSLYEACKVCREANWLQDKKGFFKFKVVDRQGQVEKEEKCFYVLEEMQTQAELEAWQNRLPKNGQSSITSFAHGKFRSKLENSFKSFGQII